MAASFQIGNDIFTASEFANLNLSRYEINEWEAGQSFVSSWLNQQQIFSQKTSGSTGNPKINKISRSQIIASAQRTAQTLHLLESMKALVCLDLRYIGGKMMLARGLELGWHMQLTPPSVQALRDSTTLQKFDFSAMVPLQVEGLMNSKKGTQLLNSIDQLIIGGAPASNNLITKLQTLRCRVYATYGMTETVSHIALQALNGSNKSDYFSLLPGVEHDLDERGCLKLKADVTNGQWIQTNDMVEFVSATEFKVLGRADNVINTGGVKVQTEQLEKIIESTLSATTGEIAITSIPDSALGQKIVLVCSPSLEFENSELLSSLRTQVDKYQIPKLIIRAEVPKAANEKIDRMALKAHVLQLQARK